MPLSPLGAHGNKASDKGTLGAPCGPLTHSQTLTLSVSLSLILVTFAHFDVTVRMRVLREFSMLLRLIEN